VRLYVVHNAADTLPLVNPILGPIRDVYGARLHNDTATGTYFVCLRKITLWRIVGAKWVVKKDAITGRRMDRSSKNKLELPIKNR